MLAVPILSEPQVGAVLDLAGAAEAHDGHPPLSDHTRLHLTTATEHPSVHLLVHDEGRLVGYAHVGLPAGAPPLAELVVHPDGRRRGRGRALLDGALRAGDGRLQAWAHGSLPGSAELAAGAHLEPVRTLLRQRRPSGVAVAPAPPAAGVTVRTWRPEDAAELLRVNAAAFAHHPEQGSWTPGDLAVRLAEPWADPAGIFLATGADGRVLGFHWTKVHADGTGEVYVLGVDPATQGLGLGRTLLAVGLQHLVDAGVPAVDLYVEADNTGAVALYRRAGFVEAARDVLWSTPLAQR